MRNIQIYLVRFSLLILLISVLAACNNDNKKKVSKSNVDTIKDFSEDRLDEAFDKAVIVFYSLPSPIETARLFKRAGATFDESILNPTSKSESYLTNKALALNLGIYGADLSYTNLFDQTQFTVDYFATTQKIAEHLGITEVINDTTINLLKENINDRDYVMGVISDVFMNSQSYLKENHRPEVATLIVAGGWVEGLYLGSQLANSNVKNSEAIMSAVADQQLSADDLLNLLNVYKENKEIKNVRNDIILIAKLLKVLKSANGKINATNFTKFTQLLAQIRTKYTD